MFFIWLIRFTIINALGTHGFRVVSIVILSDLWLSLSASVGVTNENNTFRTNTRIKDAVKPTEQEGSPCPR